MTAQINATGTIASVALDIPFQYAVYVGLVSILLCSMLGGMRGVTWTQVAQYIVLIIAYSTYQYSGSVTKWVRVSSLTLC